MEGNLYPSRIAPQPFRNLVHLVGGAIKYAGFKKGHFNAAASSANRRVNKCIFGPEAGKKVGHIRVGINFQPAPAFAIKRIGVGEGHGVKRSNIHIKSFEATWEKITANDIFAELGKGDVSTL